MTLTKICIGECPDFLSIAVFLGDYSYMMFCKNQQLQPITRSAKHRPSHKRIEALQNNPAGPLYFPAVDMHGDQNGQ